MEPTNMRHHHYTVGWVCALPVEMAAAKAMLDEIHPDLPVSPSDRNTYVLGRLSAHNVVIACLASGVYGITSAAVVATQMLSTFKSIQFGLMVGIGGGVPMMPKGSDIRLGDVVVSTPTMDFPGVVQYDSGKAISDGVFQRTGVLNKPPQLLLTAISKLRAEKILEGSRIQGLLSEMAEKYPKMKPEFKYPGQEHDRLFDSAYEHHHSWEHCDACDTSRLKSRPPRAESSPLIHYGLIASGNQVIKHGGTRDRLAQEYGILCFEMEAAGLMDSFPCLVVRGICDYADSHKNKQWQGYAAATAAAYTKELLSMIHSNQDIGIDLAMSFPMTLSAPIPKRNGQSDIALTNSFALKSLLRTDLGVPF